MMFFRILEADTKSLKCISEKRRVSSQNNHANENTSEELKIQKWEQIITKWNDFNKNKPKLKVCNLNIKTFNVCSKLKIL